jgi:hypothetical protein
MPPSRFIYFDWNITKWIFNFIFRLSRSPPNAVCTLDASFTTCFDLKGERAFANVLVENFMNESSSATGTAHSRERHMVIKKLSDERERRASILIIRPALIVYLEARLELASTSRRIRSLSRCYARPSRLSLSHSIEIWRKKSWKKKNLI